MLEVIGILTCLKNLFRNLYLSLIQTYSYKTYSKTYKTYKTCKTYKAYKTYARLIQTFQVCYYKIHLGKKLFN